MKNLLGERNGGTRDERKVIISNEPGKTSLSGFPGKFLWFPVTLASFVIHISMRIQVSFRTRIFKIRLIPP